MPNSRCLLTLLALASLSSPSSAEMRTWTHASGEQHVEAEFVTFQAEFLYRNYEADSFTGCVEEADAGCGDFAGGQCEQGSHAEP